MLIQLILFFTLIQLPYTYSGSIHFINSTEFRFRHFPKKEKNMLSITF